MSEPHQAAYHCKDRMGYRKNVCKKVIFLITQEKDLLGFLVLKSDAGSASSVTVILVCDSYTAQQGLQSYFKYDVVETNSVLAFFSSAVGWKTKGKGTPY